MEDQESKVYQAQLQSSSDRGWTALNEALQNMSEEDRSLFYQLLQPSQASDEKVIDILKSEPDFVVLLRSFARQSLIEILKRHFDGDSNIDLSEYIDLE